MSQIAADPRTEDQQNQESNVDIRQLNLDRPQAIINELYLSKERSACRANGG